MTTQSGMPDLATLIARAEAGDVNAAARASLELDRAGKHAQAFQYLTRAAQGGHLTAQVALGLRLMTGHAAPLEPDQGMMLITRAAEGGSAEALAHMASIVASGLIGEPNWEAAYVALARSAERRSASALAQINVLDAAGLFSVRGLQDFANAPRPRTVSETPHIATLEGLLPRSFCDHWIARTQPKLSAARVHDAEQGGRRVDAMRTNTGAGFRLADSDLVIQMTRARIASAIGRAIRWQEPPNVLHYAVGQSYAPHYDFLDPGNVNFGPVIRTQGQRVATALVYLNDGFDGGETHFVELNRKIRGRPGELLTFDNVRPDGAVDPQTLHAGSPPTRGEKWLLSVWVRDRPQPVV
jgi:hypothetical protein